MKLHFDTALVRRLLDHSKASPIHQPLYEEKRTAAPGLWFVGDHGLYLMSNGRPELKSAEGKNVVAYAREADPSGNFDDWWSVKREAFGGDDGAMFLPAKFIEAMLQNDVAGRCHLNSSRSGRVSVTPPRVEPTPDDAKAAKALWDALSGQFGLRPEHFGMRVRHKGQIYEIVGLLPNRPKFCVRARHVSTGKTILFPAAQTVRNLMQPSAIRAA